MNPNNNDPTNTPPADNTSPETTPTPESNPAPAPTPEVNPFAQPSPTPEANQAFGPAPQPTSTPELTPFTSDQQPVTNSQPPVTDQPPLTNNQQPTPYQTPGPNKSNKKALLIGGIIAGVVVLAIIAAVVFNLLTTVSKQDYRNATLQFNAVSRASTTLNSEASSLGSAVSGSTSDEKFQESLKEARDAVEKIKTENEKLSKEKAVRVGEGAELYKTFDEKLSQYLTYAGGLVTSVENIRPAMLTCDKIGDVTESDARVAALNECSAALNGVKDIPNEAFKAYIDKIKGAYTEYADIYQKVSAITAPFGAQSAEYRALRDRMNEAQRNLSAASRDFTTALKESDDKYDVKPSSKVLGDYLTEQQR